MTARARVVADMRTAIILMFVVLTGTGGEISLTHAMKRVGEVRHFSPSAIVRFVLRAMSVEWLWLAIALMTASFYAFLTMLSWYPVGFVVPATSLAYVAGAFGAKFLLGERLSPTRWAGVGLICLGVALAWVDRVPTLHEVFAARMLARDALLVCAAVPLAFYLCGAFVGWRFFGGARRHANRPSDFTPPVSVLKPIYGLDREAYENFASFCRQNYPEYEIVFAVTQENDPAVPIVRQLMRDFPDERGRSMRLLIGVERSGANDKVTKLCRLAREARYDLLVISDSDVRVAPEYLRGVAAPFADDRVGAVTALYRAAGAPSFGAVMDAVGSSGAFAGSALVGRALEGLKFAMGSTMATRREVLQEIGGFEALVDVHSDDYEFGKRIADRGYRVELAPEPVEMQFPSESLGSHLRHELRWLVGIRHIRPGGHFGMLFTFGIAWAAAAAVVSPTRSLTAAWLCAYAGLRLGSSYVIGVWGLRDPVLRRWLWLLPLYDFFFFFSWLASFAVNRIEWRGLVFTLEEGRMVAVAPRPNRG
jgi:ceramide glucosyltransferase